MLVAIVVMGLVAACSDDKKNVGESKPRPETATAPSTTPTTVDRSAGLVEAACATPPALVAAPPLVLTGSEITEASGIAFVPGSDGPMWVHNDSGDRARVFAVSDAGKVTSHDVPGAKAVDWEDIAAGHDGRLYVGDIGDNGANRPSITIYRFPAPDPATDVPANDLAALTLTYPDGPHNAEALMIDPVDEQLVIVTKGDGPAGVYTTSTDFVNGDQAVLQRVGELDTGVAGLPGLVTGGDISPDGTAVLVRTYGNALLYRRSKDEPLEKAFGRAPCLVPAGDEVQGEAIAFSGKGTRYVTIGEGLDPAISAFAP